MNELVENLQQANQVLHQEVSTLRAKLTDYEREIEKLQLHIINQKKQLYGKTSEKLESSQQERLFPVEEAVEAVAESVLVAAHKREITRGRKPLPDDLPRETIVHEPQETHCSSCKQELVEISREVTEVLESIPAKVYIQEHVKVVKACPCCKAGVVSGTIPEGLQPIERARPGPGLLAEIIVAKYCDHLPLNRQEEIYARRGILIPKQRMSDWIGQIVSMLEPLYRALLEEILKSQYVQADETPIDVQDRSDERNIVRGYLWGIHKPPDLVFFHYADTRSQEVPKELFNDYRGVVQTDLYAGYGPIYLPDRCTRLACLAHVRRKFVEVQELSKKECQHVLTLIGKLYAFEKEAKKLSAPERQTLRGERSAPVLSQLHEYLRAWRERALPRSPAVPAIDYALTQWREVERYLEDGNFEIDNNSIERQIRPIAVGRHNWLFAGSHDGARRAAVLYSIIGSCRLQRVNPFEYLRDVIMRIPNHCANHVAELLPNRWKPRT